MSPPSLPSVTRGPSPLPAYGPLVTGPLGPLGPLVTQDTLTTEGRERLGREFGENAFGCFDCPIPKHTGGTASFIQEEGIWFIQCCRGRNRSPAEAWAARAYDDDVFLSNIELATWWRRLAFDLGGLEPIEVALPALEPGAAPELQHVANGFALLVGLRRVDHVPRPVPYSVRFAAAWCDVSLRTATACVRTLRESGVIVEAARIHGRIRLYEPGDAT